MKNKMPIGTPWSENVIIADAGYIDKVAFNLIVNFERMLERRVPQADLARWIDCVALDGGLRPMETSDAGSGAPGQSTQVVLIHSKDQAALENFTPSRFEQELNGKAFADNLGEFSIMALPVEGQLVTGEDFFLDVATTVCSEPAVKRVMLIPDAENGTTYDRLREALRRTADDKRITLFTMQPMPGGNFRQEILGYSLMSALGIRADEIR